MNCFCGQRAVVIVRQLAIRGNGNALYKEVGVFPITHYIEVRRQSVAAYIVNRPIFKQCVEGRRGRGSSSHLYWWEQPIDLDLARGGRNPLLL